MRFNLNNYLKNASLSTTTIPKGSAAKSSAKSFVKTKANVANRAIGGAAFKATDAISGGIRAAEDKAMDGVSSLLLRKTDPIFANAYTGLAPTKTATGLFAAGAAAYAFGGGQQASIQAKVENGQHDFVGNAPVLNGDGMANKSNAPTLGADGSLVFGLHNRR